MEFDLPIEPKVLNLFHHQLAGKVAAIIYLGCGIGKLSFWDQIIGNSLINLLEDELRQQDISSCWYSKTWHSYIITNAQLPRDIGSWKCYPKWELQSTSYYDGTKVQIWLIRRALEPGLVSVCGLWPHFQKKIYLSLM